MSKEDAILDRRTRASKKVTVDYLRVGLKGTKPRKEKCKEAGNVRVFYSHILNM